MTFYHLVVSTPWWVYLLLVYLLNLGYQATKTRTVSIKKLFIIPTIFTYFSLHTLIKTTPMSLFSLSTFVSSLMSGSALGWLQISLYQIEVDRENKLLKLPGTWSTLIIILIVFILRYYFSYRLMTHPGLETHLQFTLFILLLSGICTGLFLGRFLCYLYRFFTQYSINLTQPLDSKD